MGRKKSSWAFSGRKTVQKSIPITAIHEDGVFRHGREYSLSFSLKDINYQATSTDNQASVLLDYEALIKSISPDDGLKIVLVNRLVNERTLHDSTYIPLAGNDDKFDYLRCELNEQNSARALKGSNKIVRDIYAVLSSEFQTYDAAKPWIRRQKVEFCKAANNVGTKCRHMTVIDRLKVLHHVFKPDMDDAFNVDLKEIYKYGESVSDYIAPDSMKFEGSYLKLGERYGRVLMIRDFPAQMDDNVLSDIMSLPKEMITAVDYVTMDKSEALRITNQRKDDVEADIGRRTRSANKTGNWNSDVPRHLEEERDNCNYLFDCLNNQDQILVMAQVTLVHFAGSMEELNADTKIIQSIAATKSCEIGVLRYRQERGLNTVLPYGWDFVSHRRIITSENGAFLHPFRTKEIFDNGGFVYGVNQISHNLIVLNRKSYLNSNAFIFGIPGSGKSVTAKSELETVFLSMPEDEIICLDPDGEYRPLIEALGGQTVHISATSEDHINVMDLGSYGDKRDDPITLKCHFIDGFVDIIMRGMMTAGQKSVTDRCTVNILSKWSMLKNKISKKVPTLETLYDELAQQEEAEAKEVRLALEMYAKGSFNTFAKPTNIDIQNRLICFDVKDLSAQMHDLGMLVVIDTIDRRVAANRKKGINTWLYFDEIWSLLNFGMTAGYILGAWKRFRKYGGLNTGITQNISEVLANPSTRSLVSNSEFVFMLNQSHEDREELIRQFRLSSDQEKYITNAQAGHGLLYAGGDIIPFDGTIDTASKFYKLATTRLDEVEYEI